MSRRVRTLALAVAFLMCLPAVAKNKDRGSANLTISHAVTVGGVQLHEGPYKVTWEHHSPGLTVSFSQHKQEVASATAQMVERPVTYASDSVLYNTNPDGSYTLLEIRIGGTNQAIVFQQPS